MRLTEWWRGDPQIGCVLAITSIVIAVLMLLGPVDWAQSYLSWRNLTKDELVRAANDYVDDRAPGNAACLYSVVCKDNRAGLALIRSVDDWDITAARQLAWDRKFSNTCPGQTANFAVKLAVDQPRYKETLDSLKYGVWSFNNDRFVSSWSRTSPLSAFSEFPTDECTRRHSVTSPIERSQVTLTAH